MSRVRYVNKKTGWVSIYESTPYYDPVTKSSRPKRKYIGYEDPITKEFVPSSGKPGRKKAASEKGQTSTPSQSSPYYEKYKQALEELSKQRDENQELSRKLTQLNRQIERMQSIVDHFVRDIQAYTAPHT